MIIPKGLKQDQRAESAMTCTQGQWAPGIAIIVIYLSPESREKLGRRATASNQADPIDRIWVLAGGEIAIGTQILG